MSWRSRGPGLAAAVIAAWIPAHAATPPAGFEDTVIVDGFAATGADRPTAIAYEPGSGALYVLEKGAGGPSATARVRRRNPSNGAVTTALTMSCVETDGEGGLLGIAFDPDYLVGGTTNRYVYIYYTRNVADAGTCAIAGLSAGLYNTLSRFHESGGTLSGEQVVLRGPQMSVANHLGGSIQFAPDKTLYVAMGDNGLGLSRNLDDLRGKILRIKRDGSIPVDNPLIGTAGARPEIWAYGFRNPFRISIDAPTGKVYVGDVGEDHWEEVDVAAAGRDFGWPCFEANAVFYPCNPPAVNDVKPIFAYGHDGQTAVQGNCVIGGPVYRASAFPSASRNRYFFGDFVGGWIRSAAIGTNGALTDVQMFIPDASGVVDMRVSPAGCLTWASVTELGVHETCYSGTAVSADWDQSGRVDGLDLAALGRAFGSATGDTRYDAGLDFTGDGLIDGDDLAVLAAQFGH